MNREEEIQAIRYALDAVPPDPAERFGALLVLRTVAHHLNLHNLHEEIDAKIQHLLK
jgi:hypothetical protein